MTWNRPLTSCQRGVNSLEVMRAMNISRGESKITCQGVFKKWVTRVLQVDLSTRERDCNHNFFRSEPQVLDSPVNGLILLSWTCYMFLTYTGHRELENNKESRESVLIRFTSLQATTFICYHTICFGVIRNFSFSVSLFDLMKEQ